MIYIYILFYDYHQCQNILQFPYYFLCYPKSIGPFKVCTVNSTEVLLHFPL